MTAWFKDHPDFLAKEEELLREYGYDYEIDRDARENGYLLIKVRYPDPENVNKIYELECVYPSSYPYFPVEVYGPSLPPGRHINPDDHRLCLYQDEQNTWSPHSDYLATALNEQLPVILELHKNPEKASKAEEQVGYQVTGQIPYENGSVIYVDDFDIPATATHGTMSLRLDKSHVSGPPLRGLITDIRFGSSSAASKSPLLGIFAKACTARWVRINKTPRNVSTEALIAEATTIFPGVKTPDYGKIKADILGLLIKEESEYRVPVYNWVFLVRRRQSKKTGVTSSLVRSDRYTQSNINQRVPRLSSLSDKSVVIVGLGALGSHIAWQLVRAGIRTITLIDCDVVQVGNLPRWLLGFSSIGYNKAEVVSSYLLQNFPGLKCKPLSIRVGGGQGLNVDGKFVSSHEFIKKQIENCDLVIDAAAETNLSLYLSTISSELQRPFVWATGTQGAWGGIVGKIIPGTTKGTWTDFSYIYADLHIEPPPGEEGSNIQPVGCFSPTFTGTGFDMDEISLMASRVSVGILCNEPNGYPSFSWDIAVVSLWDEASANPIVPEWKTYSLNGRSLSEST